MQFLTDFADQAVALPLALCIAAWLGLVREIGQELHADVLQAAGGCGEAPDPPGSPRRTP
jgi:hypothetical protein